MEKKYWWISYFIKVLGFPGNCFNKCIDYHPFEFEVKANSREDELNRNSQIVLSNWKLISCEDYNLWNELNATNA